MQKQKNQLVKEEVDINIETIAEDLKKGNYLGYRKLDIDLLKNFKEYSERLTDEEIYEMFGFTEDEINLIETTIKKYERYSPWFKRYICGPSSVSDEEVQKFINELENA